MNVYAAEDGACYFFFYMLVPAMYFIHNTAATAFSQKCKWVSRWGIGGIDFNEYRSLLPFTHDDMQVMLLNISGIDNVWKGL